MVQHVDESEKLAALAHEAIEALRADSPEAFKELTAAFNGKSADLVLFGRGKFHLAVTKGEVKVEPGKLRGAGASGRGATTPETMIAILEGRLTPLEAFFKGDLVARSDSAELHKAYDYFARFSDAALRSKRMQNVVARFRESFLAPHKE